MDTAAITRGHRTVRVHADLADLIPRFLENRRRDVVALRGALGDGDFTMLGSIGHAMKGAAGGYGFHAIAGLSKEIEDAASVEDGAAVTQWVEALETYLKRVRVLYEEDETP